MAGADLTPTRVRIPEDLTQLVTERRVIPFVGAGFSAALNYPTWDDLLRKVAAGVDGALPYDEIRKFTNGDPLQIAEYLYLKSYRRIGPLRHIIERELPPAARGIRSGPHVELVNLGSAQIYTTNYDDLIEDTFKDLGLSVDVITLPRDVATARSDVTQVIKYHGDLRHDETLVLTESAYYGRLDFESPMDLKFRSDLLGRSVLFMGYSFRDINIRVIWFKLMEMMRDIPDADRLPSYIVRVEPNPVLAELDQAVGLRTIVLDPEAKAQSSAEQSALLAGFLYNLGLAASPRSIIPGRDDQMFVSPFLISAVREEVLPSGSEPRPPRASSPSRVAEVPR